MPGFDKFDLGKDIADALSEMGFDNPTEVQDKSIPVVLQGHDVVVRSKTGSGKTGAFMIPIVKSLSHAPHPGVGALVIAPTRELALQIEQVARKITKFTKLKTVTVYGGVSTRPQADRIRQGAGIVVGTPGRIIDLMEQGELDIGRIKFLVLDEADVMLDMGFIDDIKYIMGQTPREKQTMLFSATMPGKIVEIASSYMRNPTNIGVGEEEQLAVTTIDNLYTVVDSSSKFSTLLAYLDEYKPKKSVIFVKTQRSADILYRILKDQGHIPVMLHGGVTQAKREVALSHFRKNQDGMLIATNVAARGIDVTDITDVINFDAPDEPTLYIHRIGRSARMGRNGRAFTIFSRDQHGLIGAIERFAGVRFKKLGVDNGKFARINFGEYIRSSGGGYGRGPRRWGDRGEGERGGFRGGGYRGPRREGGNYGAHGSRERYGPRHDRPGGFRPRHRGRQDRFGPSS